MFSITSIIRRPRPRIAVLAAAVIAAVCIVPTALAGGSNTYTAGTFSCTYGGGAYTSGNVIRVNPPLMTSYVATYGGLANIWWKPVVYRYGASGWAPYTASSWIDGAANGNTSSGNWIENFHTFQNIPAGWYAVFNYYSWDNGARASSWSSYTGGGSMCHF